MGRLGVASLACCPTTATHQPTEEVLEIQFRNGSTHPYVGVPPAVFQALMTTESQGSFLPQSVRDRCPYGKVIR